jgi:hypothetical protein
MPERPDPYVRECCMLQMRKAPTRLREAQLLRQMRMPFLGLVRLMIDGQKERAGPKTSPMEVLGEDA